jgi:predicted permease
MTTLSQDLRYAIRMLLKSPGFAAIAICTIALGVSSNTALFSVVNGVLLNPLAYPDSDQLVAVYASTAGIDHAPITYLNFLDWQTDTQTFASMAAYRNQDYNLIGPTEAERLSGYMISADFFAVLGIKPVIGRTFNSDDDHLGAAHVVVLGGGFWQREFGSAPDVLGKALTLNGKSYTVVGVVPPSFSFYGHDRDVYTPIGQWGDPSFRDRRISVSARAIGRLKPGITLAQAGADMDHIARDLAAAYPVANKNAGITLVSMKEDIVGNVHPFLLVLLAAVGFLLLIACANVANLLLARAIGRSREFAVRAALGAGRMRVIRQLLTESLLLSGLGAAFGLLIAVVVVKTLLRTLPATLPRAGEIVLDSRVLLFTLAISVFAGLVFGLVPALKSSRVDLQEMLKESDRGTSAGRTGLPGILVAGEVALAFVLLIGAGLMLRSLSALWRVNPGYVPSHAITFNLSMPASPATTSVETRARLRQFDDKMRSLAGVKAVSVTLGSRPMIHDSSLPFWVVGRPKPASDNEMPQAMFYLVEAGFWQAMGIALQRGRFVTPQDNENSPIVVAVDDFFNRIYFPNEDPLGKHIHLEQFNVDAEIIGVVGHVRQWGLGNDAKAAIEAQFFYPFMQLPEKIMPLAADAVAVVMRTEENPAGVMDSVRRAVNEIDRRDVIYGVQTLDEILTGSVAAPRLSMFLLAGFAALALILSCVGIYGVISHLMGQRTREIGVRMALGAQRNEVLRLVLGQGAKMALLGVVVGIAAAIGLMRLMANQLFGISSYDPLTFVSVALLLALVALVACYLPARRAVRVDPIAALRHE